MSDKDPTITELEEIIKNAKATVASGKPTTKLILSRQRAMTTPIEHTDIKVKSVIKDDMTTDGYAEFDPKTLEFTCYIPPYVEILNVNREYLAVHYMSTGQTSFANFYDYVGIFSIKVDDSKKRCCSWYSPSASDIKNGAEQVSHYPYAVDRKQPGCFNPDKGATKNSFVNCTHFHPATGGFQACHASTLANWEPLISAYKGDELVYVVERSYYSNRIPNYRLHDRVNNVMIIDQTEDIAKVRKEFDALSSDLAVKTTADGKTSYFKTVLSG